MNRLDVSMWADAQRKIISPAVQAPPPSRAEACVHELFEAQVARTPDAPAVVFHDISLSYAALNRRANQFAHHLRKLGVRPDVSVVICMDPGFEMVAAVFAVLKAGGAYVPVDPSFPSTRLQSILCDCTPAAVVTQSCLKALLSGADRHIPIVEADVTSHPWSDELITNLPRTETGVNPQCLAYTIYTSGSTGAPKGVMVEHRGLCNYLYWALDMYDLSHGTTVSSSIAFDGTITSFYPPLLCGSPIRLLAGGDVATHLTEYMRLSPRCGLLNITPTLADVVGEHLSSENIPVAVSTLVLGGEKVPRATVRLWQQLQPGIRIVNEYGPTETINACIAADISADPGESAPIPIGQPTSNVRAYILDTRGEPVSSGGAGELYIAGPQIARGYLRRPELTAARFLPDPFDSSDGNRMYRTGDLCRWLPDGNIEFLQRSDYQIKLRGYRIELGEIEAVLRVHKDVRDVAVVLSPRSSGEKIIVAYVAGRYRSSLNASELKQYLAQRFPGYMLPAAVILLEALPITTSGKADRSALENMGETSVASSVPFEQPRSSTECELESIWKQIFKLEHIGVRDNLFELGGHSLTIVRLSAQVRAVFGVTLSIKTFFEAPTIEEQAAAIEAARHIASSGQPLT